MKVIDNKLFDSLTEEARINPRLRKNYNFHDSLDEPIHRLLNAVEPGTYVQPHRHSNPDKEEIFFVLRGKIVFFIFNDDGSIEKAIEMSPDSDVKGLEIRAGVWHSLVVVESGTILYEIKSGPYVRLSPENIAPWAPAPDDKKAVDEYIIRLLNTELSS